jgi:hypothetical protein
VSRGLKSRGMLIGAAAAVKPPLHTGMNLFRRVAFAE